MITNDSLLLVFFAFLVQGAFTVVVPSTTSSMALVEFRRSWGVAMANGKAGLWSTKPPWVVSLSNAGKCAYDALFSLWMSPNENGLMFSISIWTCTCLKNTFGSRDRIHAYLATSIEKLIQPLFARKLFNFKISWTDIIWIYNTSVSFFIRVTIVVFFILTINFQEASNSKSFEIMQRIMASYRGRIITTASPLRREVSRVLAEPSDKNLHSWGFSGPICPNSFVEPYCYHLWLFSDLSPRSLLLYLPLNLSSWAIVVRAFLQQKQKNPISTRLKQQKRYAKNKTWQRMQSEGICGIVSMFSLFASFAFFCLHSTLCCITNYGGVVPALEIQTRHDSQNSLWMCKLVIKKS